MALFQYFKKVDGNSPGTKLPDPQGALSKEVPSPRLRYPQQTRKLQLYFSHQLPAVKAVRGTYLKISAEKEAEIRQRATEHHLQQVDERAKSASTTCMRLPETH